MYRRHSSDSSGPSNPNTLPWPCRVFSAGDVEDFLAKNLDRVANRSFQRRGDGVGVALGFFLNAIGDRHAAVRHPCLA